MAKRTLKEKLNSSTLVLALWTMLIITIIVLFKLEWALGLSMALVSIPLGYVAGNKVINYRYGTISKEEQNGIQIKDKPTDIQ